MLTAMRTRIVTALAAACLLLAATLAAPEWPTAADAGIDDAAPQPKPKQSAELRREALARAVVWIAPPQAADSADLRHNPEFPPAGGEPLACRFELSKSAGSSPKFECRFDDGEVLKVKYGSAEVHTEVAATRLMSALGAGADRMYLVETLRCFGCPKDPFPILQCLSSPFEERVRECAPIYADRKPGKGLVMQVDYGRYTDFKLVAIERKAEGWPIEAGGETGWAWSELDAVTRTEKTWAAAAEKKLLSAFSDVRLVVVDPARRAERDALRLLAVFLNNWDNRPDNQRLLCVDEGAPAADGSCRTALAYMHDVGATFGHVEGEKDERKLDVEGWGKTPIWKDRASCTVSIRSPRLHGATFGEAVISEGGRRLFADRVSRLREQQVRDLFEGARFADFEGASPASRDVELWVRAFQDKVRQIATGAPCPVS